MYNTPMPTPIVYYKSLISGEADWYRFPLLQYFFVFLFGLLLGKLLKRKVRINNKIVSLFTISTVLSVFVLLSVIIKSISKFPYDDEFQRWPPSISFLGVGLVFSTIILLTIKTKFKLFTLPLIKNSLIFLGKNAFSIYLLHIIILQIGEFIIHIKLSKTIDVFIAFLLVILTCSNIILLLKSILNKLCKKQLKRD